MTKTATVAPSSTRAIGAIIALSMLAIGFLSWLLFVHHAVTGYAGKLDFLPALNAVLNGCSAIALTVGFYHIRHRNIQAHRNSMLTAFVFSSLFLISYIVHHALHGDKIFAGHGAVRTVYLTILISHILLSVVALPLILITFFFALTGRFPQHRRIAPFTLPLWLYVSVTGVVVYAMLAAWR